MKKLIKIPFFTFLLVSLLFSSCSKEEDTLNEDNNPETITANSNLADLILRSSQNSGSFDDIIDNNSCASVILPAAVIANGQKIVINTEADYATVAAIFNQSPNDTDTLEIIFPINIVLEDFTQVTVNNQSELDIIIAACNNGGGNDSINCVDFEYPITFFVFDANQEQTDSITVNSDFEMFVFLSNLGADQYIGIEFPIAVIVNGQSTQVNNYAELQVIINNADCSSGNDDPINSSEFTDILTSGVWYITYFFDDYDETSDFNGYEFTFASNNTAQATNGSNTINGNWNLTASSTPDLDLYFGNSSPFDELDDDWEIIEATSETIVLKDISGGDGSVDYLTFGRTPNTGGSNSDVNALIEQLTTGAWYINLLDDDGNDETCHYVAYEFLFNSNGMTTATSTNNTVNGFWSVETSSNGNLDLILNYQYSGDNDPFEDLNDDWDVLFFDASIINLQDISGGNGGTDNLHFTRTPFTGCTGGGDVQALRDIMVDGSWFVQSYVDDGDNETNDYNGYTLTFDAAGTVVAQNSNNTINGTWNITTDSSGLDFVLDFGTGIPFDEFNDDWDVLNFSSSQVTLEDISGGNGGTDTLVFAKL